MQVCGGLHSSARRCRAEARKKEADSSASFLRKKEADSSASFLRKKEADESGAQERGRRVCLFPFLRGSTPTQERGRRVG